MPYFLGKDLITSFQIKIIKFEKNVIINQLITKKGLNVNIRRNKQHMLIFGDLYIYQQGVAANQQSTVPIETLQPKLQVIILFSICSSNY